MRIWLILLGFLLISPITFAEHVKMASTAISHQNQNLLAITLVHEKDWHTYWKNPGDAGIATKFEFFHKNKKIRLAELEWPNPKKYIEAGNILAYGYADTQHFFFELPQDLKNQILSIKATWLVCKDICIPGQGELTLKLDHNLQGKTHPVAVNTSDITEALSKIPKREQTPAKLEIYLTKAKQDNRLALQYTYADFDITKFKPTNNLLTPFPAFPFDYKSETLYWDEDNRVLYGRIYIDWDGAYEEPAWPLPEDGIFQKPIKAQFILNDGMNRPSVIEYEFSQFAMTGDESLETFFAGLEKVGELKKIKKIQANSALDFLYYILFAFLGGLILNLMPCVLPVISLKLFGLVVHSDEPRSKIMKHNFAYALGVIASFMVLAVVVLILKTSGEKIGWGFQLQSPVFVFIMMITMFVMALNMFGLFEFVTPGGKTLGNAQIKQGVTGDFINGVLATILSTPCSAPFLGAALTFAFTTSNSNIFLMLFFVGFGLAFPFILTAVFPKLVSFLPRPGLWMEKLKYLLGLSLILTFVWLHDVLANLIDFSYAGIYINSIFALIFFAFFFRKFITRIFVWNVIFFVLPIVMTTVLIKNKGLEVAASSSDQIKTSSSLEWKRWSTEKLAELASNRKWVFMDFTAKWCLTCKVNKKVFLETKSFEDFARDKDIELLVADWTKRDDYITDFLRKHNLVGVPAYFIQKPNGELVFLGETISLSKIKEVIK
jgi:thiol:disulfide interchange protein